MSPLYRKLPVTIEAMQLTWAEWPTVCAWLGRYNTGYVPGYDDTAKAMGIVIRTLEGDMRAELGDWIIRGVKGEFYPCKPDIFEATYEAVVS